MNVGLVMTIGAAMGTTSLSVAHVRRSLQTTGATWWSKSPRPGGPAGQWASESEGMYRHLMYEIALGVGDDPEPVVPDTIPEEWLRDPPQD